MSAFEDQVLARLAAIERLLMTPDQRLAASEAAARASLERDERAASPVPAVADDPEATCTCPPTNVPDEYWCPLHGTFGPVGPGSRDTKEDGQ